jgi:hypothetical protein
MLCDPESGALRDYGHTRYRPPPHLEAFVRHRDGECPMPTCHHPAERGQIDHIVPARPDPVTGTPTLGATSAGNLAAPCHHHHLAKDAGRGFTLHRDPNDGGYTWTTPLGYTYTWQPDPLWHPDTDPITGIQADWADGYARPPDAGGPVDQPTADPPGSGPPTIPAVSEPNSAPTGDPPGNGPPKAGTGAHPAGAKPSIPGTSPTAAAGLAKSSGGTRTSPDPPEDDPPPF